MSDCLQPLALPPFRVDSHPLGSVWVPDSDGAPGQVHPGRSGTRVKFLRMGFSGFSLSCVPPSAPGVPYPKGRIWVPTGMEEFEPQ